MHAGFYSYLESHRNLLSETNTKFTAQNLCLVFGKMIWMSHEFYHRKFLLILKNLNESSYFLNNCQRWLRQNTEFMLDPLVCSNSQASCWFRQRTKTYTTTVRKWVDKWAGNMICNLLIAAILPTAFKNPFIFKAERLGFPSSPSNRNISCSQFQYSLQLGSSS